MDFVCTMYVAVWVCGWRGKNGRHGCTVNGFGATVVDVYVCMHVYTLCMYIYRGRSKTSLSQHQSQDTPPASATPATKYVCMSTSSHLIVRRLVSSRLVSSRPRRKVSHACAAAGKRVGLAL